MGENRGNMSPNHFTPGYNGYNAVENPVNNPPGNFRIQSSPGEVPWSPGGFGHAAQYAQVPQNHEMGTGAEVGHARASVISGPESPGYVSELA